MDFDEWSLAKKESIGKMMYKVSGMFATGLCI